VIFFLFGLYRRYWRYASVDELVSIILAVAVPPDYRRSVFGAGILGLDNARSLPARCRLLTGCDAGRGRRIRFSVRIAAHNAGVVRKKKQ